MKLEKLPYEQFLEAFETYRDLQVGDKRQKIKNPVKKCSQVGCPNPRPRRKNRGRRIPDPRGSGTGIPDICETQGSCYDFSFADTKAQQNNFFEDLTKIKTNENK